MTKRRKLNLTTEQKALMKKLKERFEALPMAIVDSALTRGGSAKEASADAVLAILADRDLSGNVSNPRMAIWPRSQSFITTLRRVFRLKQKE
jgi:hypothetical protein